MNTAFFHKVSKGQETIHPKNYKNFILSKGISLSDSRIQREMEDLEAFNAIDLKLFQTLAEKNPLLYRIFSDDLVIPEWAEFKQKIQKIFDECVKSTGGIKHNTTSVMQRTDENLFGMSITTIDGQTINLGDTAADFCASSIGKVFSYMLAVEEHTSDFVHGYVGKEPCGQTYRALSLKKVTDICGKTSAYVPHNPFSEAGGLMCSSLFGKGLSDSERFYRISNILGRTMGQHKIGFSYESFLSERNESDRKACMAFMMRERKSFPEKVDISKVLELYYQLRSFELNTEKLSVFAGTLANGGVCPLTGETVFDIGHVRDCLSLMLSCGLYDYSGEWAFKFGMPGKSSMNGCIIVAIPNIMGICIFSPRVDINGISVRARRFAEMLVEHFSFHHLDHTRGQSERREHPCQPNLVEVSLAHSDSFGNLSDLMGAASSGDIDYLRGLVAYPVDLMQKNYDRRTSLHIAASKGYMELVRFLLFNEKGEMRTWREISQMDRWGLTPLDVAVTGECPKIVDILRSCGAKTGEEVRLRRVKEGGSGSVRSEVGVVNGGA